MGIHPLSHPPHLSTLHPPSTLLVFLPTPKPPQPPSSLLLLPLLPIFLHDPLRSRLFPRPPIAFLPGATVPAGIGEGYGLVLAFTAAGGVEIAAGGVEAGEVGAGVEGAGGVAHGFGFGGWDFQVR